VRPAPADDAAVGFDRPTGPSAASGRSRETSGGSVEVRWDGWRELPRGPLGRSSSGEGCAKGILMGVIKLD
jgi:hypothetical protein